MGVEVVGGDVDEGVGAALVGGAGRNAHSSLTDPVFSWGEGDPAVGEVGLVPVLGAAGVGDVYGPGYG